MTETKTRALVAMVGLLSVGLAVGCSSSGSSTTDAGTGKGGSGGSTTGTGGKGGSGGSGTGTGGSTGSGGSTTALGCPASDPPPTGGIIGDFMSDAGIEIMGGITAYGVNGTAVAAPTFAINGGALKIMQNAAAATAAQYVGVVIYFNGNTAGTDCIDAHTYTGVKFDLSGSVAGCSVQYSTNDSAHTAMSSTDLKAGGPAGSYSPQATLTAAQITTAVQTIMMPFTGTGAPSGGSPATPLDPTKLEGVQWQFTIPAAGTAPCVANLTIDNVTFY
jgi:hypothetical protein